jgi:hypothetical protein
MPKLNESLQKTSIKIQNLTKTFKILTVENPEVLF